MCIFSSICSCCSCVLPIAGALIAIYYAGEAWWIGLIIALGASCVGFFFSCGVCVCYDCDFSSFPARPPHLRPPQEPRPRVDEESQHSRAICLCSHEGIIVGTSLSGSELFAFQEAKEKLSVSKLRQQLAAELRVLPGSVLLFREGKVLQDSAVVSIADMSSLIVQQVLLDTQDVDKSPVAMKTLPFVEELAKAPAPLMLPVSCSRGTTPSMPVAYVLPNQAPSAAVEDSFAPSALSVTQCERNGKDIGSAKDTAAGETGGSKELTNQPTDGC